MIKPLNKVYFSRNTENTEIKIITDKPVTARDCIGILEYLCIYMNENILDGGTTVLSVAVGHTDLTDANGVAIMDKKVSTQWVAKTKVLK